MVAIDSGRMSAIAGVITELPQTTTKRRWVSAPLWI